MIFLTHPQAGEMRVMGVSALDEVVLPGGDVVLDTACGYGPVLDVLAAGVDVRLGHEVAAVRYGCANGGSTAGAEGVSVTVRVRGNGHTQGRSVGEDGGRVATKVFRARAAVVTLPLGVLRGGGVAFHPPLERSDPGKAAAVAGLGTAVYNKVCRGRGAGEGGKPMG